MYELVAAMSLVCFAPEDEPLPDMVEVYSAPLGKIKEIDVWIQGDWGDEDTRVFDLPPDGDEFCYKCNLIWREGLGIYREELSPVDQTCLERTGCHLE